MAVANRDPLVHVGYPKTASTWLQEHFFPHHPDLDVPWDYHEVGRRLVRPHAARFDADAVRARFQADRDGPDAVVSNEHLVGHPLRNGHDAVAHAKRLHAVWPKAKVWIVVRRQEALIASLYNETVKSGSMARLEEFLEPFPGRPSPLVGHLDYDWVAGAFADRFGEGNVLVSFFEEFRKDPRRFLGEVCRFAGIPKWTPGPAAFDRKANPSLSPASLAVMRASNVFLRNPTGVHHGLARWPGRYALQRVLRGLDRSGGRRRRHQTRIEEWADGRFRNANRRLAARTGKDLGILGYQV